MLQQEIHWQKRQIQRRDAPKKHGRSPHHRRRAETVRLAGAAGGYDGRRRPALWGNRSGKRRHRAADPSFQPAKGALCGGPSGQHPGTAFRKRVLRARKRLLYRRYEPKNRVLRNGQRGDPLHRRSGGNAPEYAGQALARTPEPTVHACGRHRRNHIPVPPRRRHQPRSAR